MGRVESAPDAADVVSTVPGRRLPVWRAGLAGGVVGMLCCVGPSVLALLGVVGAGTAYTWSIHLYDGYAWWFRVAGLVVLATVVGLTLRSRDRCGVARPRRPGRQWLAVLAVGVVTYGLLYAVTTWLGTFATP